MLNVTKKCVLKRLMISTCIKVYDCNACEASDQVYFYTSDRGKQSLSLT